MISSLLPEKRVVHCIEGNSTSGPHMADEWTQERLGQKFIPRIIIWDEICTVTQTHSEDVPRLVGI